MSSAASGSKAEILLRAQMLRQSLMELEQFERRWKQSEKDGSDKETQTQLWMEVMNRRENYRTLSSLTYETPLDLTKDRKKDFQQFFQALDGFTWSNNFAYTGQPANVARPEVITFESPCALFDGVICKLVEDEVVIQQYNATGFGLRGEMPSAQSFLHMCEHLNLSLNRLCGKPPLGGPKQQHWTNLKTLRLAGNQLSNTTFNTAGIATTNVHLLTGLQQLTQLEVLDLSFNDLCGPLPDIFSNMKNLGCLNLAGNQFEGVVPMSLQSLTNLKELKLYSNKLTGAIPDVFANLRYLKTVNLSQNRFTSGVNVFNNIVSIEMLILSHNQLTDELTDSIGNLRNLQTLHLQHNQLAGILPDGICRLKTVRYLDLSHNQFHGHIPMDIGDLESVEKLLLMGNNLIGPVPKSIGKLIRTLRDFYVFRPFPSQLSRPPRSYSKRCFERVYIFGPSVGIDNVFWVEEPEPEMDS